MWSIERIEAFPVELDFSSSGQGRRAATAIEAAGVRLFNAIELVAVESSATQVEICEGCGVSGCEPGGWVAFRRLGERVVWIPAWSEMAKGERERSEYAPPSFLRSRGIPVLGADCWNRLRTIHGGLPAAQELPRLDSREAARWCQWSAPGLVLGEFPAEPRLRRDALLAVTEGDLATEATAVDRCLREHDADPRFMEPVPSHVSVSPIEFWLDLPGTPGWTGFAHVFEDVRLLVDGNLALIREGGPASRS